jgi:hypothetical protein
MAPNREFLSVIRESVSVHSHTLVSSRFERDLFSPKNFQVEDQMSSVRERYGEAFWRAHALQGPALPGNCPGGAEVVRRMAPREPRRIP